MVSPLQAVLPNTVFADRYRVLSCLGKGGMGAVMAAQEIRTGRRVAIKCLLPGHCGDSRIVARFRREARATIRLRSEHVAHVLDAGEHRTSPDAPSIPYLVMEHLEGNDLKAILERVGKLLPEQAADLVIQTCAGLAEAHALGIVHRDLKPANLFLARMSDGRTVLKILDFGVAKFESPSASGDDDDMTAAGEAVGSYSFMSPEQILDASSVDARADIWSLGVVLHHAATGERPFEGESLRDMAIQIIMGAPRPLDEARSDLPPGFADVVQRCLQKDRNQRFGSVVELARALSPFSHPRPRPAAEAEMFLRTARITGDTARTLRIAALAADDTLPGGEAG